MQNLGYIKLHRKSLESTVFEDDHIWKVWTWCLMKANHKPATFNWNGEDVKISAGQFITGRDSALLELNPKKRPRGLSPRKYRTALSYLKSTSRIATETTNRYTIISIVNWAGYQLKATNEATNETTKSRPASDQQATNETTTNKNDIKNDKNEEERVCSVLKNWNERQSSPVAIFKPEHIVRKHGVTKIDELIKVYGKQNNGFSQFLDAIRNK